jgi:pyridoxal phosphate enzyme (YggS family)
MGIGRASGENRAVEAAQQAIASPLLELDIHGAQGILWNITGSSTLSLFEVNEAAEAIKEAADPEANIIFGTSFNERLGEEVMVTVIATGFDGGKRRPSVQRESTGVMEGTAATRIAHERDFLQELERQREHGTDGIFTPRLSSARRASSGPPATARRVGPRRTTPTISRSRASCAASDHGRPTAGASSMTDRSAEVEALRSAYEAVLGRVAAACRRAGRDIADVTVVAVSKTVPTDRLQACVEAGITTLGENRVQEAEGKVGDVTGARWHLVGPLQSNKARRALETFDVIQTVDSVALAERLDRLAREVRGAGPSARYPVLLQVNVDDDPSKAGFSPDDLPGAIDAIHRLDALDAQGLMTIGRLVSDGDAARPTFVGLRRLSERLREHEAPLGPDLSMGMTDDFEVAVEEGATIVRVGRAIFGERPHQHAPGEPDHAHAGAGH